MKRMAGGGNLVYCETCTKFVSKISFFQRRPFIETKTPTVNFYVGSLLSENDSCRGLYWSSTIGKEKHINQKKKRKKI